VCVHVLPRLPLRPLGHGGDNVPRCPAHGVYSRGFVFSSVGLDGLPWRVIIFRMTENTATPCILDKPIAAWKTPEGRERRRQRRDLVRNYFAQTTISPTNSVQAACAWLVPWDARHYPGVGRGTRQLMGNRVDSAAVRNWRSGGPTPLWARRRLEEEVRARATAGLWIADALAAEISEAEARPRTPRGLQIIDPDTGLRKHQARRGRAKRRLVAG
jgi:hypothetical protein